MGRLVPKVYYINSMEENGAPMAEIVVSIYNLYTALYYLCNNLDACAGTLTSDFLAGVGTPLSSVMAGITSPHTARKTTSGT